MIRPFLLSAALLCLALPASAQGHRTLIAQAQTATAPSVGPEIVLVRVAGPWQSGSQRGFSRLVGTAAAGGVSLSVEWISDAGAVVQTTALTAPAGAENLPLARMRGETGANDSIVYFDTGDDTFVLTVGAPGAAKFGLASN